MQSKRINCAGALALSLVAVAACAETPVEQADRALVEPAGVTMGTWLRVDADTGRIADVAGLELLAEQFPDSASVQLRLLNVYLEADRVGRVHEVTAELADRGFRFSEGAAKQLNALFVESGDFGSLDLASGSDEIILRSAVAAEIPVDIRLVESVIQHRSSGNLYVTSIVSRGLFRLNTDGMWTRVDLGEVGSLTGIAQSSDGWLWMSSGVFPPTPDPETAFAGLVGYHPESAEIRHISAPEGVNPSDIAIGPDGALYASDPVGGGIYMAKLGEGSLSVLVAPGTFRSPQGIALSADGKSLYISDYRYGLALLDFASKRIDRLQNQSGAFLDGTDGLWLYGDRLVAIQNGANPMRIVSHRLSEDGRSIVETAILESAHSAWTEPLSGSLSGNALLYIATGQWDRFGERGAQIEGKPPIATAIRSLDLEAHAGEAPE